MNPVCVIGHRFREEKEQFVLCWLYKNTLDSVLLASDYNSYPRVSMEENRKTSVNFFKMPLLKPGNLHFEVMDANLC